MCTTFLCNRFAPRPSLKLIKLLSLNLPRQSDSARLWFRARAEEAHDARIRVESVARVAGTSGELPLNVAGRHLVDLQLSVRHNNFFVFHRSPAIAVDACS